ncbi:MAG: LutB/LldF family L-lactate oxidation iron-sulfur protein [Acidobacteriota bacterium]
MSAPPPAFEDRVRDALASPQLRVALQRATQRFASSRTTALASLPHSETVREQARDIRARTLARLPEYLGQFADAVEAAGGRVHWAADGESACRIVRDIAASNDVRRIVKSKSMVSEEIGLNGMLETAGFEVVESDLGEYIVQLAGHAPSHLIAPAIHLTKEQVGRLLHEKLGIPLTDNPEEMTAAARVQLRQVFLTADMGVSGVNFGVARTGSLCLVTNEGNGRMTTSLPRIHVALMGIERLVPTLGDLSVMLQVLARSATGQKLSVYTSVITGPRRAGQGEPDGPEQLHVVLLDNGRAGLLGTDSAEILFCIRCGACLNTCPVYQSIGGHAYGGVYSGPVGSVLMPGLFGITRWQDLPHASSLCGACRDACPVRIDLPSLLLRQRKDAAAAGPSPSWLGPGMRLYRRAATLPALFRAGATLARLTTRLAAGRAGWLRRLPPPLSGWTRCRDFPALARESFHTQYRRHRAEQGKERPGHE